jgi:hypothetical protein
VFELLKSSTDGHMRLPGQALGRGDVDHRLLRQHADELPDGGIPAGLTKLVEPEGAPHHAGDLRVFTILSERTECRDARRGSLQMLKRSSGLGHRRHGVAIETANALARSGGR